MKAIEGDFVVRIRSWRETYGVIEAGPLRLVCAIGNSGVLARKREGDGATPAGRYAIEQVLYRADRVARPRVLQPVRVIRENDGWCDAVCDRNYNRPVRLPYPARAERLWRDDGLYDIVVVLSHNRCPRVQWLGSAIFMHVAHRDYSPTEGCIALKMEHLRLLLSVAGRAAGLRIG